jgi:3-mercaptopyruvate sulfurtransferase SseA
VAGFLEFALSEPEILCELIADGRLRNAAEIRAEFAAAGVDVDRPVVTSCGSGDFWF